MRFTYARVSHNDENLCRVQLRCLGVFYTVWPFILPSLDPPTPTPPPPPPAASIGSLTLSRSRGVADAGDDLLPHILIGAPASRTAPFHALCLPATLAFMPPRGSLALRAGRKKERKKEKKTPFNLPRRDFRVQAYYKGSCTLASKIYTLASFLPFAIQRRTYFVIAST